MARPRIEAKLNQQAEKKVQKPGGDKHKQSPYFLKGILHSKQGNHAMTGRTCGKQCRYYLVNRGRASPVSGCIFKNMIPAQPLEDAVLNILEVVLTQAVNLKESLTEIVKNERRKRQPNDVEIEKLEKERKKLVRQIDLYIEQIDETQDPDQMERLQLKRSRLRNVNQQLKALQRKQPINNLTVDEQVEHLLKELTSQGANLRSLPPAALRRLAQSLISSLTIDLETREVQITLALPDWVTDVEQLQLAMCLDNALVSQNVNEAHNDQGVLACPVENPPHRPITLE